jgi:predicted glycosyltransferase
MKYKDEIIWFDLGTPKQVTFFEPIIKEIQQRDIEILITTRISEGYTEPARLLELRGLKYYAFGEYGGEKLKSKLSSALNRQIALNEFIQNFRIRKLVNLGSVDGCRVAFGNGIEIVSFFDIPSRGMDGNLTPIAKLTLPLSSRIFHPFVVPREYFTPFVGVNNVYAYNFLDPIIYLQYQKADSSFFERLPIDKNKKTILFREEEYKASYVLNKKTFVYDALKNIDANLIIIPRYETGHLREEFPNAITVEEKMDLSKILPFVDIFIGGGGTINIEACYWGTPVISTRSFVTHYDKFLIDNELMFLAQTEGEIIKLYKEYAGKRLTNNILREQNADVKSLVDEVIK